MDASTIFLRGREVMKIKFIKNTNNDTMPIRPFDFRKNDRTRT